jgi:serine-rich repeat adhesion-like glycoprotein
MSHKNLSEIDGLVHPELVGVEVVEESGGDISRGDVILKGALAAGAVYGAFMVGPFVRSAFAMGGGTSDVDILNFALTLEYLESTFYEEAMKKVKASGELKPLIKMLAGDEKQHVEALEGTIKKLGGKPVAKPTFNFEYSGTSGFLKLAETFENVGVGAYNGAGPMLKSKDLLAAAGSIVQIEARHAAVLGLLTHQAPAPDAFDKGLSKAMVTRAVAPLIKA